MLCSSCGGDLPPGSRFCPHCGTQQSAGDEERRVVTVLFADVVGFTALAETLDPENVKHLIDRTFDRLAADIVAFGGVVDKILGDGIVALFGAPVAHEDDPERAVRAGLRMQQTMAGLAASSDAPLMLRIGVNTGEVLVGMSSAGGDYTAMGDTMNLASRLEGVAEPGRVLVGPATHQATVDAISYRPFGQVKARGRDEVVDAWVALNPIRPPGARSRRSVAFVGREAELAALEIQARLAFEGHRCHAALVTGEAGMGKTRIVQEVAARVGARYDARVIEGRAVPYGEANLWWPVADVLRQVFALDVDADPEHARLVVDSGLEVHLNEPDRSVRDRYATALLHALGYLTPLRGGDRDTNRAEVMLAFTTILATELTRRPVVLVMSDVHYAAEGVRLLLEHLLQELARMPFLLLATAKGSRPVSLPPGRHGSLILPLAPLADDAALAMLEEFGLDLDVDDRRRIVERSGGNPLYLEELAKLMTSRSSSDVDAMVLQATDDLSSLPDNLRGMISARLDALDPTLRSLVEAAAVFGPNGPVSGLARMAQLTLDLDDIDPLLNQLIEADLIVVTGHRYEFRSDLVRDVAYATLTKTGRAITHHGIASYLDGLGPAEHRMAIVLVIARHYAATLEILNDLDVIDGLDRDEVVERATYWLNEAGNRALAAGAPAEAEHWYSLGVELLAEPDVRAGFHYGRARARSDVRDITGARSDLDVVSSIVVDDPLVAARVLLEHGELDRKSNDMGRSAVRLTAAAEELAQLGDFEKQALALRLLGMTEVGRGDVTAARAALEASRQVASDTDDRRSEAWALQGLGLVAYRAGDLRAAEALSAQAVEIFDELGDRGGMAWARGIEAWVAFHSGDWERARHLVTQVRPEVNRRGDPWAEAVMSILAASIDLWSGAIEASLPVAEQARERAESVGDLGVSTQAQGIAGRAMVALGDVHAGRQLLEAAYHAAERENDAEAMRIAAVANAGNAALIGEPESAIRWAARFSGETHDPEMLGETDLAIAVALATLQRGAVDEAASQLGWLSDVSPGANLNAKAIESIVAAARGDLAQARASASFVVDNDAATYLDVAFAHLALAATHHQEGDAISTELAFASAKLAIADTDDVVMPLIVNMAEAAHGMGDLPHIEIQFRGLGLDPDGWRRAWLLAASGGRLPADQLG